jgi:hypothetical protein
MDIIGSRCACACSEAGFGSQNGDRAWGVYYRRAAFCYAFFVRKRIVINKCFLFMVKSICRVKWFTTGSRNFLKDVRKSQDARPGAEVAETTVKRLLCCRFRHTVKAMGQVYQCWWRMCWEINVFFQVWISNVLCFIAICDLFTDSPLYYQQVSLMNFSCSGSWSLNHDDCSQRLGISMSICHYHITLSSLHFTNNTNPSHLSKCHIKWL